MRILQQPAFAEIEAHPQTGAYARSYYPAVHGDNHRDLSFAVCSSDVPVVVVLCTLISGTIGLHGLPLRMYLLSDLSPDQRDAAAKAAFSRLDELVTENGAHTVVLREPAQPFLSPIGEGALARRAGAKVNLVAQVDLTAGPGAWRKALRKSFRSCVNWGRRNLAIESIDRNNPNAELFDRFRSFHAQVAGRVTRPTASWDVMYAWITAGHGELVTASLEGKLAAASLFIDGTETCIYMTGVYDRSLFDKPLAHFPLWLGMERAQARGMKILELGDLPFQGVASDKEFSIGYFKRGFATHVDANVVWQWSPPPATSDQ